jgi:hypothetical protein
MNMKPGLRKHARFAVKWPVTYLNEGLSGEGTVLDISQVGCQVEGTLAVTVGMLLKLLILPPHKEEKLCVEEGRVLWVKEGAFALELQRLPPTDHRWLLRFLENAERRNSYRTLDKPSIIEDLAAKPLTLPLNE